MKFLPVTCALILAVASAFSQPAPSVSSAAAAPDPRLETLAVDLKALARIVDLSRDLNREKELIQILVNDDIEALREPRPDGTYRWASLQRVEDVRVKEEHRLRRVSTEQILDTVTMSASNPYRLEIRIPSQRGFLRSNTKVYVRNVVIDATGYDGKTTRTELPVNLWIDPKDGHGIPLPEIAKSAQVTVELGVESGGERAVAEISLLQAKLVDDPQSPNYPAVRRLLQIQELASRDSLPRVELRNVIDEAILNIPGELEKRLAMREVELALRKQMLERGETAGLVTVGDATPDVLVELQHVLRLSRGTVDEQNEARTRLESLLASLTPPAPPAP
ncbi:MAG TPA: hypothetical protein VMT00_05275 [Thermoanaerobaculia bacterium]|nr:hypothetical protein [Thermoanaerobaculia bacterium]